MPNLDIIHLNVGGERFSTTVDTIMKCLESELARLVGKEMVRCLIENRQEIFIDRDGRVFRYILEYLQHGRLLKFSEDKVARRELLIEAEYYKLEKLRDEVQFTLLDRKMSKFKTSDCVKFCSPDNIGIIWDWI